MSFESDIAARAAQKLAAFAISTETAENKAKDIGFSGDTEQLRKGMEVEQEHGPYGPKDGKFDLTGDDTKLETQIAAAHIAEIPDYYDRLDKMEEDAKKEAQIKLAGILGEITSVPLGAPWAKSREEANREMIYRLLGGTLGGVVGMGALGPLGAVPGAMLGSRILGLGHRASDLTAGMVGGLIPRRE